MAAASSDFPTIPRADFSVFDGLDNDTAQLILQLRSEDIGEMRASLKVQQRGGVVSDSVATLDLMEAELRAAQQFLSDRRMAESITAAVRQDALVIASSAAEETRARSDRDFAQAISRGVPIIATAPNHLNEPEPIADTTIPTLADVYVSEDIDLQLDRDLDACKDVDETMLSEASTGAASPTAGNDNIGRIRTCIACGDTDQHFDCVAGPCGHDYCRSCMRELFQTAFDDASYFPPRCCQQLIPISNVRACLTASMEKEFYEKELEHSTPNKTYCCQPSCSAFILPSNVQNQTGTCTACTAQTCTICKAAAHTGEECPSDPAVQALHQLAQEMGWQQCFHCQRMVELDMGCNHMTCVCRSEFCYVCGQKWRSCECVQWDENRLVARAHRLVNREAPEPAADNPLRAERVDRAVQLLRDDYECNHQRWEYVRGENQCEECRHTLEEFIFRCRQCRILSCARCRRNRL